MTSTPRSVWYLTTDLDRGNDARDLAARFGFALHVRFPKEGLPRDGILIVGLDELLLDAHGRRGHLEWLQTQPLPPRTVICSRDFHLGLQTVVRPGLLLAPRLDEDVFRAHRDGHLDLPSAA